MKYFSADLASKLGQKLRTFDTQKKFISSVTHDLRTPLTSARMGVERVMRELGGDQAAKLQRVLKNIDRVDVMVKDLLDVHRIQAGEDLQLSHRKVCLNDVIKDVITDCSLIYGDRFLFLETQTINGVWCQKSLCRIFENLLLNAHKYGSDSVPVTIWALEKNGIVTVYVHNEGNPISEEDQKHLFQQFQRIDTRNHGWGLGLSLVKWLVEAHHGYVRLTSTKERGTTFCVHLPLDSTKDILRIDEVDRSPSQALN